MTHSTAPIGFIGLGVMGARMAARLTDSNRPLLVYDIHAEAAASLLGKGARLVANPAEVADQAEIVFCSLPIPTVLEGVLLAPDGVARGKSVKIVVDLSTTGPDMSKNLAPRLAEQDVLLLDCPVSGGAPGAETGTLTLMASGPPTAFARVEPLLQLIGNRIFFVGEEAGLAQTMKLVNNLLFAANALSAFEVLTFGAKAGLDSRTMIDIVNVSSGRSFITTDRIPQTVLDRTFPNRFATSLLSKDVKLGIASAEAVGAPLPILQAAQSFLSFAMTQGYGGRDCAELIKIFEGWSGTTVGDAVPSADVALNQGVDCGN